MADTQQGRATAGARLAAKRAAKAARKAAQREADRPAEPAPDDAVAEDEVLETVEQARSWLDRNQKFVWGVVGIAAAVGVAIAIWSGNKSKAEQEATRSLADGTETALAPIVPESEAAEVAELELETFPTLSARAKEALSDYRATLKDFAGTDAARIAQLGEANSLLELEKYSEAEVAYRKVTTAGAALPLVRFRALEGLGFSLEGQEKFGEAQKEFEKIASIKGGAYAQEGNFHAARMLVDQGKPDEGIKRFQELLKAIDASGADEGKNYAALVADAEARLAALGAPQPKKGLDGLQGLPPEIMEQLKGQLGGH